MGSSASDVLTVSDELFQSFRHMQSKYTSSLISSHSGIIIRHNKCNELKDTVRTEYFTILCRDNENVKIIMVKAHLLLCPCQGSPTFLPVAAQIWSCQPQLQTSSSS